MEAVDKGILVPILVSETKGVLDGQHRLEGSRLALQNGHEIHPLPFIMTKNENIDQIKTINTTVKSWRYGDYTTYGIGSPNPAIAAEYQRYDNYFKEYGSLIKHNELRMICLGYNAWNSNVTKVFENVNNFKIIRTDDEIKKIYNSIFEWGQLKKCNFNGLRHFQRALLILLSDKNYNNKEMIKILNSKDGASTRNNLINKDITYTSGQFFLPMKELWNNTFPDRRISVREPKI
jgi:hypothetical protein